MKIWVDDIRPAPEGYVWCKSANEALRTIMRHKDEIALISLDHDSGLYHKDGGDFIKVLTELERLSRGSTAANRAYWSVRCKEIVFKLHTANPVGRENMRRIIEQNGWRENK